MSSNRFITNRIKKSAILIGGVFAVRLIWLWTKIHRSTTYSIQVESFSTSHHPIVYASNHQTKLDSPAVFTALRLRKLLHAAPVKFMTWHKYYNTVYKPLLWLTGCYPTHGDGLVGIEAGVEFAKRGYGSFIYPEGKRTPSGTRNPAFKGISQILEQLPHARLILIHIEWKPRQSFFSRPQLTINMRDAPKELNASDPNAIMDAIYET